MSSISLRETLTKPLENLLLFSVFFVALPHAGHLGLPVFLYFGAAVAWRYAARLNPRLQPGKAVLFLATLAAAGLVYSQYHRFYGRDGGSALFLVGLGLKVLEMKTRREVYLVVYLAFFVALTQYLFSQTIPMALYTLGAVTLSVAVLIGANGGPALPVKAALWRAGSLVAQAVPVMVVLFVFFPRMAGPLWKLPDDERRGRTGLSDFMEPGSIGRLAESGEAAFRVDFRGDPPPPSQRYWRGPVFWHTDGARWTATSERVARTLPQVQFSGPSYAYTVTLEPSQQNWVFALELPEEIPADVGQTAEFLLLAQEKILARRQFALTSRSRYRTPSLASSERARNLQLPGRIDDRIRALIERWREDAADDRKVVALALGYFRQEEFSYTLRPPVLDDHPIERFLFETRQGFCEHFATAFVYLMRAAGIPARVVTGYQGGIWNPLGKFLEVRQADAHAWSEVWLPDQGWTRIDPTAAVAPSRIDKGVDLESQVSAGEVRFNAEGDGLSGQSVGVRRWLRQARMAWASVDHAWNQWVLAYNPENQQRFWNALGIVDWRGLMLWMGGLLGLCGTVAALLFWPRRAAISDPVAKLYRRFLRKLARRGVVKKTGEGPVDFAGRAAHEQPALAAAVHRITDMFVKIRYGRHWERDDLDQFRRLVKDFRP